MEKRGLEGERKLRYMEDNKAPGLGAGVGWVFGYIAESDLSDESQRQPGAVPQPGTPVTMLSVSFCFP